jgi:hypothetical protein
MELKIDDLTPFRVLVRVRPLTDKEKFLKPERTIRADEKSVIFK